ncbi:MAG: mechanosensitive ion channel [Flavobacteriaceae bacterium]|nr:mechanosensitive ion channel [Flavobacteriaceae bacterium]
MDLVKDYFQKLLDLTIDYSPKLLVALLIFFIGIRIIRLLTNLTKKMMVKRELDITLQYFLSSLVNISLKVLLFILVVAQLGVQTSSFIAILGAASLAIGLSLQGSLANFAGGVLILIFKPFKVGDFIDAAGVSGTVKAIGIFNTKLNTVDNQLAIVPNGKLSNDTIINYNGEETRRKNFVVGISYGSNIKQAKEILLAIAHEHSKVLKDPEPVVFVAELAESSVNLSLRIWAKNEDFWDVNFYLIEETKTRFDAANIEIPFPQRVVHSVE